MNKEYRIKNNGYRTVTLVANRQATGSWVLLFLSTIAIMVCFVFTREVLGQEASSSGDPIRKYNITFPISTLGNCEDLQSCKEYCEDEANKEACVNFAKTKGFYKAPSRTEGLARQKIIFQKAQEELGCSSAEECKEVCQEEENKEKCAQFAKKYNLAKPAKKGMSAEVLERAKSELGCSDGASCRAFCQLEANREKCSAFAVASGLSGGIMRMASMSAQQKRGFEEVKKTVDGCMENPESCAVNFDEIEKMILEQGDEYCRSNPAKCREMFSSFSRKEGSMSARQPILRPDNMPEVQGISRRLSFFDWLFNVFLK